MNKVALLLLLCLLTVCAALSQDTTRIMPGLIMRYGEDLGSLERSYPLSWSAHHRDRIRRFLLEWKNTLAEMGTGEFSVEDQVDYRLFENLLEYELEQRGIEQERREELVPLLPFAADITMLDETRRNMEKADPQSAADLLNRLNDGIAAVRRGVEAGIKKEGKEDVTPIRATPVQANRAVMECRQLGRVLDHWYHYYAGYDPLFTWWVAAPYQTLSRSLKSYADFLMEQVVGVGADDKDTIIGDPIGRDALLAALKFEMISYTPEELIRIAEMEYDWCERNMKEASRELGFGDDWLQAVEYVKTLYVPPGDQPELIRNLALEAIDFVEERDLVTVPPLARESWRMEMMSAERQKVSPFFLGGEVIMVAFPLDSMQHEQKMMSLRGNNIHFARATVHHELIPGHHLQGFMMDRFNQYRHVFWTPFWVEGWALYWEMRLWDLRFPKTAEDRVGMLFWRMHRCARIIFSLSFHLGTMTPQECIDMLVERVGHERDNATAEVRRSFGGSYPPLYQVAYMIGTLQFRALYEELVVGGRMTDKQFHDRILEGNVMPVEAVRWRLSGGEVPAGKPDWRFYPGLEK